MKKQIAMLIWSAVVLFVIIASFVGVYLFDVNSKGYRAKEYEIFSCISTEIEEYSVADKKSEYTLEKTKNGWRVEDNEHIELDEPVITKLLASASNIKAIGTVNKKQFTVFETEDTKTLEIDVEHGKGIEITFYGKANELCAFSVSGDRRIYVMYAATMNILTPTADSLRISQVFPNLANADTLPEYYFYKAKDGSVTEVRVKTNQELAKGKDNRYIMEKPFKREVDDELFEQQLAVKIPALKIAAYEDFVKKPEVYGLDEKTRSELRFKWNGEEEVLYLGISDGNAVYAAKADLNTVFKINSSLIEFLEHDPFYILDAGILKADISNVKLVYVKHGEKEYIISATKLSDDNVQFMINGRVIGKAGYSEIMDILGDIDFMSELDTVPEYKMDAFIKVTYDNGAADQNISLTKINDKAYAVFMDNKAEFAISVEDVNKLFKVLEDSTNNLMIN